MKKYLICLVVAVTAASIAAAPDDDLRAYCGDLTKANGESEAGPWALRCARTLQVQRDYAQRADQRRKTELILQQTEWMIQNMRNKRLAKQASTEAEKQVAEKNLSDLHAACPIYFTVMECIELREERSK